ncbi:MAG TPA: hypothetical protein VLE02_01875 [Nitrosarchaeum sp.]|nr:hypothetical protein [Nitrosarchaeum sp.]
MNAFRRRCKNRYVGKYTVSGGGLIIYDNIGIYCIKERKKDYDVYNDVGGKYQFEDGDIFATIAREFAEETYYTCEITRKCVVELLEKEGVKQIYLNNPESHPVYLCVIVPNILLAKDLRIDANKFKEARTKVLENNPTVPTSYYNSLEICHVPFTYLKSHITDHTKINFRLSSILKLWLPDFFSEKNLCDSITKEMKLCTLSDT